MAAVELAYLEIPEREEDVALGALRVVADGIRVLLVPDADLPIPGDVLGSGRVISAADLLTQSALRTVNTGQGAKWITRSATLPRSTRLRLLRPWVPMITMSARSSAASWTISW